MRSNNMKRINQTNTTNGSFYPQMNSKLFSFNKFHFRDELFQPFKLNPSVIHAPQFIEAQIRTIIQTINDLISQALIN